MSVLADILGWILILAGSGFMLVGAWGLGMCVQAGFTLVTVKLIIMIIFLFITGPSATHAVANAALMSGSRPKEAEGLESEFDESKVAQPPVRYPDTQEATPS